jgi:acyl-coenzyme A synthetase/AMP-(fatty) acid ligase
MRPDLFTEEKRERFVEAGHWVDRTLLDDVEDAVVAHPDRTAVVDRRGSNTYAELSTAADDLARGLSALGVGPDDVVAHQLPNRREGAVLHLATLRLGAILNPIVTIYRESEVRYMLETLETSVYVVPRTYRDFEYVDMARSLAPDLPALDHVVTVEDDRNRSDEAGDEDDLCTPYDDVVGTETDGVEDVFKPPAPDDLALVQFTSGTTGRPKAAMHTENTLLVSQTGQIDRLGLDEEVVFTPSPIGHLTGVQHGYRLAFTLEGTCVFQQRWDPTTALEWIDSGSCTYMAGATPFVRDLALHEDLDVYDTSSLRTVMTAGAPCQPEVLRQAHENFERLTVCRGWGQTENTLPTVNAPGDPEKSYVRPTADPTTEWKPGSDNRAHGPTRCPAARANSRSGDRFPFSGTTATPTGPRRRSPTTAG